MPTSISSRGSSSLMTHRSNSDLCINKSDLQIYLGHYKNAIENKKRGFILIKLAEVGFLFSIFFTSDFKNFSVLTSNQLKAIYLILATCISLSWIRDSIKSDDSKYKEVNPEKMTDIIENNCIKLKK